MFHLCMESHEVQKIKYLKINKNTEFGFHRLAINGLNDKSDQPITIDNITSFVMERFIIIVNCTNI